jgi:hypothetical protein
MKLILEEKEIKELEAFIQDMPFKYAQPILAFLGKFVKNEESNILEEKLDEGSND